MIAYKVSINGKRACVAGMDEAGVVVSSITWVRGVPATAGSKAPEHLAMRIGGLRSRTGTHVTWLARQLGRGDSVHLDVVDVPKVDRPKRNRKEKSEHLIKREQEMVERKAAAWGWKILK
jgi:hypothetical protein